MFTMINNVKIQHIRKGKGEPILLLHGWGGSMESLSSLSHELIKKGFMVFILDLPGFGKSETPKEAYTLDDYADLVEKFVKHYNEDQICIFGHSFGGSIAIKMAIRKNIKINKLILCNSSGIRSKKNIKLKMIHYIAKGVKRIFSLPILKSFYSPIRKIFYYYILRQRDYIDHQDKKETFQNILSEDVTPILDKVTIPTLLIWGEKDKDTPVSHGKRMLLRMKNAKLNIFKEIGHGLPIKKPDLVAEEINQFVMSDK
jgi:pimeloyl-ACP methyl ester carboxylesterase